MGALGPLSILLSLISSWFQSTISKAHISGRQHILYHDLLDRSKSDLDSMEVNRVLPCISALLRICNHADFRSKKNFDFIPIKTSLNVIEFQNELAKYPKLVQDLIKDLNPFSKRDLIRYRAEKEFSWNNNIKAVKCNDTSPMGINGGAQTTAEAINQPIKMKIQEENSSKIILTIGNGQSMFLNTIEALKLKINQRKAKRKGNFEFINRVRPEIRTKYPWASCPTLTNIALVKGSKIYSVYS